MNDFVTFALVGAGMFVLGWFSHAWASRANEAAAQEDSVATSNWRCTGCSRVKALPTELDGKVMVCNNCQVRLVRAEG